jgi:hypothetical protein
MKHSGGFGESGATLTEWLAIPFEYLFSLHYDSYVFILSAAGRQFHKYFLCSKMA